MNKVYVIGRLLGDPEIIINGNTNKQAKFSLIVEEDKVNLIPILVYGDKVDFVNTYLRKGKKIFLEGKLEIIDVLDDQGIIKKDLCVIYLNAEFVESKLFEESRVKENNYSKNSDNILENFDDNEKAVDFLQKIKKSNLKEDKENNDDFFEFSEQSSKYLYY